MLPLNPGYQLCFVGVGMLMSWTKRCFFLTNYDLLMVSYFDTVVLDTEHVSKDLE